MPHSTRSKNNGMLNMSMKKIKSWIFKKKTDLNTNEIIQLDVWKIEIGNCALKSSYRRLSRKPPAIKVIETENNKFEIHTTGEKFVISRNFLFVPTAARKYLIAHELGHIEGRHPRITFSGALLSAPLLVSIFCVPLHHYLHGWVLYSYSFCALLSIRIIYCFGFTMIFEWDADWRGARMTSVNDMANGMNALAVFRNNQSQYYPDKINHLNGPYTGLWKRLFKFPK